MKKAFFSFFVVFIFVFSFSDQGISNSSGAGVLNNYYGINSVSALDSTIDTLSSSHTTSNGLAYDGRYFYLANNAASPSTIYKIDYVEGVVAGFTMPAAGNTFGIGIVRNNLYIADWTNGNICKLSKTGVSLATYTSPGGTSTRGVTSDGTDLFIASTAGYIFRTDTLLNILDTLHISTVIGWPMDLAYIPNDSSLWVIDNSSHIVKKLNIQTDPPTVVDSFTVPNGITNTEEGIAFDGNDLWVSTYSDSLIFRFDPGYSKTRIALFMDRLPWGFESNEEILCENNLAYHLYKTSDMGAADLSKFTKAIIAGCQPNSLYVKMCDSRTWWESWISQGGVLQIGGATYVSDQWSGNIMPGGATMTTLGSDTSAIRKEWHPLLFYPETVTSSDLTGWGNVNHGYFENMPEGAYNILLTPDSANPTLSIYRHGKGGIIYSSLTLEYGYDYGYSDILKNIDLYWAYGASPNVLWAVADGPAYDFSKEIDEYEDFGNIDYMDCRNVIPTMEDLSMYDVVLTYPNYSYMSDTATGDSLAEFADDGGWVITCGWSWYSSGNSLQGKVMSTWYNPFYSPSGENHYSGSVLGWFDNTSPLVSGVDSLYAYYRDSLALNLAADTVSKWDDGEYLIGYRDFTGSRGGVIGFNLVPSETHASGGMISGNYIRQLHNLMLVSELTPVEEIAKKQGIKTIDTKISSITSGVFSAHFSSPVKGSVKLSIVDKTGRIVASKEYSSSKGLTQISFNASSISLASGVYFFNIETENQIVKGKFLLFSN